MVLVAHAPPERRLFALNDVAVYPHRREDGTPDIVLALTTLAKSSASSCADNLEQVLKLVPQLGDAAVAPGSATEALAGSVCFPGLLAPSRLAAAADAASGAYIDASRTAGEEIDQRLFLREPGSGAGGGATAALDPRQLTPRRQANSGGSSAVPPHGRATPAPMRNISSLLGTPMRPAAAAAAAASTPNAQLSGMRSPAAGAASRSPISRMFVSAQWLRQLTTSFVPSEIDPVMMRYLAATGDDPAVLFNTLLEQAQGYAQQVFPSPQQPQAVVPLALAAGGRGSHVTPTKFGSTAGAGAPERPTPIEELAANAAVLAANQAAAAQSRRAQAISLHFRMLTRVLTLEEQKLTGAPPPPTAAPAPVPGAPLAPGSPAPPAPPAPNFGQFLRTERIMRTLFSVCADCVADAMHVVSWQFPAFQHALQVLPFEAVSVVHLVAECDREMPYELKRSLGSMMDQLLDHLIWERGSGFYMHLLREKGNAAMPAAEDVPPADAATGSAGGTASAGGAATGGSAATGVSGTAAGGSGGVRTLLPLRFCSVAESVQPGSTRSHCCKALLLLQRLLSRRLINISERLVVPLSPDLVQAVHSTIRIALFEHTSLFYGRHADSILICCMYGCAKAAKYPRANAPLMFREIVGAYRAMKISDTGAPPDEALWRAIPVAFSGPPGDPALEVTRHDDLVRFYNEVFLREIKPAMLSVVRDAGLLQSQPRRDGDVAAARTPPPGSPAATGAARAQGRAGEPPAQRAPFAVLLSASPRRVTTAAGGGGGVMVSPMRPDRAAELRASVAAPRALYAFVGDSTTALTSPSHDLDRFNDALRSAAQRGAEGGAAAGADAAEAPPSAGRDRRRTLTRQELPPPSRRRISEQL